MSKETEEHVAYLYELYRGKKDMPNELEKQARNLALQTTTSKEELQAFARSLGAYQASIDNWRVFQNTSTHLMNLKVRSEHIKLTEEEFKNIKGEYANGYALGK